MLLTSLSLLVPHVPHLYMDVHDAHSYMSRWKPQIVCSTVHSITGVKSYTRARLTLTTSTCVGAIVSNANMMYVIQSVDDAYYIASILWDSKDASIEKLRDLRMWCEVLHGDRYLLNGDFLDTESERELWDLSAFEL